MSDRRASLESALRAAVTERLGPDRFELWFGHDARSLGVDGESLTVRVPNGFSRDWIRGHYAGDLLGAGEQVLGVRPTLDFRIGGIDAPPPVDSEADPRTRHAASPTESRPTPAVPKQVGPPVEPIGPPATTEAPSRPAEPQTVPARPRFETRTLARPSRRLDDFVVGDGTRLAHAAAVEMSTSLGASFNPLYIHGGVGLGKSHLLEGVSAEIRARAPGKKLVHVTAESFTNSFLEALRTGSLPSFRARHRSADVLVMDDVHFLAAKRATVDEFLHTFNALTSSGAAIILSGDQHPRQIAKLTDELATRFLGGMVVRLEAPAPSVRRAILRSKAAARGVDVPDAVLDLLADHLRGSVRELEGALHSVIAHASLTGRRLDVALARSALRDTIRFTAQAVALRDIEKAVGRLFGVDPEALRSDGRARSVSHPRMLAMYLARKHAGASYSEIGRHFGGRNHSTVISAEKKVRAWLDDEQHQGLLAGFERVGEAVAAVERELGL